METSKGVRKQRTKVAHYTRTRGASVDDHLLRKGMIMECTLYQYVPGTVVKNNKGLLEDNIFITGEAPGAEEVRLGTPFIGRSGQLLRKLLEDIPEYYLTNIVKCRPPNNRNPNQKEIEACRPKLIKELKQYSPSIIVLVGKVAAGLMDQPSPRGVLTSVDHVLDYAPPHNLYITHILHPAATLYNPSLLPILMEEVNRLKRSLQSA